MGFCTCDLIPEFEHPEGHSYKVTIETAMAGLGRLNVACMKPDSDAVHNSQGADLTAGECRALANMLNAAAALIEEGDS